MYNNSKSLREACEKVHETMGNDLVISNLGSFCDQRLKEIDGPFKIDEIYCSDSLQSIPNVFGGLVRIYKKITIF